MREALMGLVLTVALNVGTTRLLPSLPLPFPKTFSAETAVETGCLLSLGMRRLAADFEMIRLLVYYGTREPEGEEHKHELGYFDPDHPENSWGGGRYLELGPRARRIISLDPSLSYVALYAAGALAYNLNRPDEAIDLIELAQQGDRENVLYQSHMAAIAFHRKGNVSRVLASLEPTLAHPDCPTMIKSMAAFLYKRTGRRRQAIAIYNDIVANSRDAGYRAIAARKLSELEKSAH